METGIAALCFGFIALAGMLFWIAQRHAAEQDAEVENVSYLFSTSVGLFFSVEFFAGILLIVAAVICLAHIAYVESWDASWENICQSVLFFLPCIAANQAAGLALLLGLPGARAPLHERWLGEGKTWGAFYGVPLALVTMFIQDAVPQLRSSLMIYYVPLEFVVAVLLGLGAIFGDCGESFIKRRLHVLRGECWWPWDQVDFAIGGALFAYMIFKGDIFTPLITVMFVMLLLHPIGNYISFRWLKIRSRVL